MDVPFISIIVPVYNAEKTIGRAIKSILNQTNVDFELLLVNDGSTDNSWQIMERFAERDSRIRVFTINNSGVSNARNYGLKHAGGRYTTFLDADDYYLEGAMEHIYSLMDDHTQLVIYGYFAEYEKRQTVCRLPSEEDIQFSNLNSFREYAVNLIKNEMINAPWNKIYLTSYLKENSLLFSPDLTIGEDLKFNLSVIKDIQYVKIINKGLVTYTMKKGVGLVSRFRSNRFEVRYSLLMDLKELLTYWGILYEHQAMIDRMLMRDIMAYFMDFYKNGCQLSYLEKLDFINRIISQQEIKAVLSKKHNFDFSTMIIERTLRTNNSRFILLVAKILNIKRAFR